MADYVQTLTHELKSPLSAIRGATELLQEPNMPPASREQFLRNIAGETQRIQEVVDRMLELTALEARRSLEHVAPLDLGMLVDEAVAAAAPVAAIHQVHLRREAGTSLQVEGDPFLLRRAIDNLLANAIDFSPAGGEIAVRVEGDAREARVRVDDQGPGIPAYAQQHLFEKFYSLPRPGTGRKSTGLGLSFVRHIATLHHGRITLTNREPAGATATLTLPR